jgi:hypothetical protein
MSFCAAFLRTLLLFVLTLSIFNTLGSSNWALIAESLETGEGVRVNKDHLSQDGVTLVPEEGNATVKLITNQGLVLNVWNVDADRARLLPNCNLLVVHGTKWGAKVPKWKALRNKIREYDWNGKIVWEYEASDPVHHDVQRLPDGSTYFLKRTLVPEEWQFRIQDPVRRLSRIRADSIVRIDGNGNKVSVWHAHEHLDLNIPGSGGWTRYTTPNSASFRMADWTHINTISPLPDNKWYDRGDTRFTPGNLLIQARNWSTTMIIDKDSGNVVWEYAGDSEGRVSGGHEPVMIENGLPGAGNILLLDNGRNSGQQSRVLEIDPITKGLVWSYTSDGFYTASAGSAQRQMNGNTIISEDRKGRVFEVAPSGEIVWEYRSEFETNRARRYPSDYCPIKEVAAPKSIQARLKFLWDQAVNMVRG